MMQAQSLQHHPKTRAHEQKSRRPDEGRTNVRDPKLPPRHLHDSGHERNRSSNRPEEPSNKNTGHPEPLEECVTTREKFGIADEVPVLFQEMAETPTEPEGYRVAHDRAEN